MEDEKDPLKLYWLAECLSAVGARMVPRDAAAVTRQAAASLARAIKDSEDPSALLSQAEGLLAMAARMEPKDAASATAQAATAVARASKSLKSPNSLNWRRPLQGYKGTFLELLAQDLSAVALRLESKDAAQAAAALAQAMNDTSDARALNPLARGLSAAARLEPEDAATVTVQAATTLIQHMILITYGPRETTALPIMAHGLIALLSAVPPAAIPSRTAIAASAAACPAGTGQPLTALALFIPAAEPPPCRLSTQQLVKMPPCVGEARRIVLDQLGNRYHRTFVDVWEFVRFAREQNLSLDFTTPPQRPEPAAAR
jgi:hypothetical protein